MGTAKRERQKANRQVRLEQMYNIERRKKATNTGLKVGGAIVALVAVAIILALTVGKDDDKPTASATSTTVAGSTPTPAPATTGGPPTPLAFTYGTGECPKDDGSSPATKTFTAAPKQCIDPAKTYTATFDTTEGTIVVALDTKVTPGTTNNFVALSRYHYYDGSIIFRTDPSIDILQGGGKTNRDSPGYTIPDEANGFTYVPGDLVMARGQAPNSGGGQFFIATGDNVAKLNSQGTYVTFGRITQGLDVAQKIMGLHEEDPSSGLGGAPSHTVTLTKVTITES